MILLLAIVGFILGALIEIKYGLWDKLFKKLGIW